MSLLQDGRIAILQLSRDTGLVEAGAAAAGAFQREGVPRARFGLETPVDRHARSGRLEEPELRQEVDRRAASSRTVSGVIHAIPARASPPPSPA